ncbi:ABC transporter ATP-binding protein [Mycoplasmopsis agalactiae]|uniref:ABC transporter, ATP binding protein n=1 Tax=Mycoplasmopsis agalactiae TaxID=2110 RepID=D3VQX1_MYCAA|nr:ABC transporter ATP-binding protein [Mycoplasmopsis agalactiae]KAB6718401.1 ABC transporter ATP-binding protein [Mycoplasmopsis agalactiae]UUM25253.1 ABC transporter ATP-binding protein [Mycoplasmopsis agalactiae]CBH40718.1 ABC transporter, ATP binding protein [Mycoplasmopsis agalactiae]
MDKVLEVIDLTKVFNKTKRGIKNVNITINSGDFHAFIGENGAGKTTTIKSIIGAYPNYSGQILIYGKNIKDASVKSIIGYVPENAIFPKELSVYQYLYNFSILSNIPKKQADLKIKKFLKLFNIEDLENDKPYNFSSGQKKKVLLIQALLHDPKLLILDEPAANLDPTARYELFSLLKSLNENDGIAILISSHVLSEIDKYVNSVTLIHNGNIIYSGAKKGHLETLFYEKVINT